MNAPDNQNEIIGLFADGFDILENALIGLIDDELDYTPLSGGWTIRQIIHHIADGEDIWKNYIKIALGNEETEFSLKWYTILPQIEWAKRWHYDKRPINESLVFIKAVRNHIIQLLEYSKGGWYVSAQFRDTSGEIENVPVGAVIKMQADHLMHHVKRISEIKKEINDLSKSIK